MKQHVAADRWKWAISLFGASTFALWAICVPQAIETIETGKHYSLGIERSHPVEEFGSRSVILDELVPDGPLASAGAEVGDRVMLAPEEIHLFYGDPNSSVGIQAGEPVRLVLQGKNGPRQATLQPQLLPERADYLRSDLTFYLLCPFAIAIGLLVGFRQPRGLAYRSLATSFLLLALISADVFLPPSLLIGPIRAACSFPLPLTVFAVSLFLLNFGPDRPGGIRGHLRRVVLPPLALINLTLGAMFAASSLGIWLPGKGEFGTAVALANAFVNVGALIHGWTRGAPEYRLRFKWLAVGYTLIYLVPGFLIFFSKTFGTWTVVIGPSAYALGYAVLVYAVLRRRVVDFAFTVNRAAVYTVTTGLLLVTFGLLEWAAEHLLRIEGREENMLLDAGIALAVFLAFHRVRDAAEQRIEQLLFHHWHVRNDELRRFIRRAAHITRPEPLLAATIEAIDRYTGAAGCAVYQASTSGAFLCAASTLDAVPTEFGADAPLVVALRESELPLLAEDVDAAHGFELALPMKHRGILSGYILLGAKSAAAAYRPDEIELLAHAAQMIGLDLNTLLVEALKADNEAQSQLLVNQEAAIQALEKAIQSMGGRVA